MKKNRPRLDELPAPIVNHSHLPQPVRLELLIGHLADALAPARTLIKALRLQANASVTTRTQLEALLDQAGALYQVLRDIRAAFKQLNDDDPIRPADLFDFEGVAEHLPPHLLKVFRREVTSPQLRKILPIHQQAALAKDTVDEARENDIELSEQGVKHDINDRVVEAKSALRQTTMEVDDD
jgi:hypothetical protein